jgi:hypothetical protein
VVVHDLYFMSVAVSPDEADSPPVVYPDAEFAGPLSLHPPHSSVIDAA